MKQNIYLIITLLLLFSGCRKYENGPSISFRTKETRLLGNWLFENESIRNTFSFDKNGNFEEIDYSSSGSFLFSKKGSWQWSDKKTNLSLNWILDRTNGFYYVDNNGNVIQYADSSQIHIISQIVTKYKIYRLTMKEMWIGNENEIEFKLTKQ